MLWVPNKGRIRTESNLGSTASTTFGTSVTTGGSSSTKGTVVELIASTAFDAWEITVYAFGYGTASTSSQGALDILAGASTEEVIIENLLMGYSGIYDSNAATGSATGGKIWRFPLHIPAGTRISARTAGARTSTASRVGVKLRGGQSCPWTRVARKVTTYGMGTVPDGTSITSGTSGSYGSWTQITASTSEDHFGFIPSFQHSGDTNINGGEYLVDIGVGSATEESLGEEYRYLSGNNERMQGPLFHDPVYQDVPSGTRLAMRAAYSNASTDTTNGVIHALS